MAIQDLKEQIVRLPEQPGVYLYFNADGETIYIGKARALRDRVRNYLGAYGPDPKTNALLDEAARLEVIVTDSVVEALALENNLIKQRAPKYNILLRDDKTYPYLQLTTNEAFPRVLVARRVARDGSFYAGPFMPAQFARKTMSLTHRLFGIRSCNEVITGKRDRPCLEYDIKRCIAPCVDTVCSADEYGRAVKLTHMFLEGRNDELIKTLEARMLEASVGERFEEAGQLRDAMRTVQTLRDRQQKMATTEFGHRDVFGLKLGPQGVAIQVFQVRSGRVVERIELGSEEAIVGSDEGEVLAAAIQQFYELRTAPPEIHVPSEPDEREALEAWLSSRAGRRARIVVPQRGEKRGLVDLATRNAALAYTHALQPGHRGAVRRARDAAERPRAPVAAAPHRVFRHLDDSGQRDRGVDGGVRRRTDAERGVSEVSNPWLVRGSWLVARGSETSGSDSEARATSHERRATSDEPRVTSPNDFAAMHEVVLRRYRALLEQGGPFPDLIVIDGGKGQLSAAYEALGELGLANLVAVGIAKKEELLYTREHADPIALARNDSALLLVQRMRDEAHRFAVTFHRQARAMRDLRSELDEVPGVGPRRRRALLTKFGSVAGVRRATREELAAAVGAKLADAVLAFFASRP